MKRFLKISFLIFLFMIFLIIGFFLWASSPNLPSEDYARIYELDAKKDEPNKESYRILTYNIGYLSGMTNNRAVEKPKELFADNMKLVETAIQTLDPDVIAFQEIDYLASRSFGVDQEKEIAERGYSHIARSVNWDKKYLPFPYYPPSLHFGKIISGQSIISKYPIREHERVVLQRNDKNPFYYDSFYIDRLAQVAHLEIGGQKLVLINVHLEAYDKDTRVEQMRTVIEIYNKYSFNSPTVLLGDFNSDPNDEDPAIKSLMALPDLGNAAFDPNELKKTFSSRNPTERLDYIFYNTTFIEEISSQVPEIFGEASDHLPVLLEFKFKNINYGKID